MEKFIGRENEMKELQRCYESQRSEFVVIYGRRRIGKTFLVRNFFHDEFTFHYVGAHNAPTKVQLFNFTQSLNKFSGRNFGTIRSWSQAFICLEEYLDSLDKGQRKVIFIDEMPWIDTFQSEFVSQFEYFWNSYVMMRDDIVLVACGSATSWMSDNLIDNQGGLHNRITSQIYLRPFTLRETRDYLRNHSMDWDDYDIVKLYMYIGGVPFYLSLLNPELSLIQNVDNLFFKNRAPLSTEFDELYSSLFSNADKYIKVVRFLYTRHSGFTKDEIAAATKITGGQLTKILRNLEKCDFISQSYYFKHKNKDSVFRLKDFYTIFYFKYVEPNTNVDEHYWTNHFNDRGVESWQGFSFEQVCLQHIGQIKTALGIDGVACEVYSWHYIPSKKVDELIPGISKSSGAQIDLIISRADKVCNLCEMKFSDNKYVVSKDYADKLRQRRSIFSLQTGVRYNLRTTFVTIKGVERNCNYSVVDNEVTSDQLFS